MAGRQAKVITDRQLRTALAYVVNTRYPARNRVLILLSHKAGLRSCEMAALRWDMFLNSDGQVSDVLELPDGVAKMGSGRTIPLNNELQNALEALHVEQGTPSTGYVVRSERARRLRAESVCDWFASVYRAVGLLGASSHSGRRGFVTRAAREISKVGGSLRDVQQLAGHRSLATTQRYIEPANDAQRRVVNLI